MGDLLKRLVMRWLRIPPDPRPPAGSRASVRVFRAARGYYRYLLLRWGIKQLSAAIGLVFVLVVAPAFLEAFVVDEILINVATKRVPRPIASWAERLGLIEEVRPDPERPDRVMMGLGPAVLWVELFGVALFLVQLPLTFTMVRLDYDLRWYIVTDRSLRIREGVASIREATMTFANIQNLSIRQGPLQRLLGIADLMVRTAGGGKSEEEEGEEGHQRDPMHIAYFRGIDNAVELRDAMLASLHALGDAGLGETVPALAPGDRDAVLAAALRMLGEARALRTSLAGDRGG